MANSSYHHGDLRNALIETGIAYINENGTEQFSLRKIAAECGVSHTAPYSHFKDKEDLLNEMKQHVSQKFANALQQAVDNCKNESHKEIIGCLGEAYVGFFCSNPQYYKFVFERENFEVNLNNLEIINAYSPFEIFKTAAVNMFIDAKLPKELYQKTLIKMWGLVHGIAGISIMNGIEFSGDWAKITKQIIFNI